MRDRKSSEVGNYDLTRVAEEVEEGTLNTGRDNSSELKRRIPVVSLGQGKCPDDFVDAFKPPTPSRAININRRDLEKPIRSSPPHSVSPRKFAYIGESPPSGSVECLSQLGPRCPVHHPRHSLDAPVLRISIWGIWAPTGQRLILERRFCATVPQTDVDCGFFISFYLYL